MRPLGTFPLPPGQIQALALKGYLDEDDLIGVTPAQLSNEIRVSVDDARQILKVVKEQGTRKSSSDSGLLSFAENPCKSALQLLEEEENSVAIVTFCAALDDMLRGGIQTSRITEVCGPPGIGKTQLGLQLAVDVQIPSIFGGLEGSAVYIDTEGSFMPERVVTMAESALRHLTQVATSENDKDLSTAAGRLSAEKILQNIHVYRCHDYIQLIALSHILEENLKEIGNVKLIVVDSIAFPFRHAVQDFALRSRMLQGLAQSFVKLANKYKAAVVFMNQMTTKLDKQTNEYSLTPALGESWGHACAVRIVLSWKGDARCAHLYKSPSQMETTATYAVTADGIRDVDGYITNADHDNQSPMQNASDPPQKKLKVEP